jgi:hypothetical protein
MLSIINAAEVQFRHDVEVRNRELALIASIRERRAARALLVPAAPVVRPASARTARAAWARPIGIKNCTPATACAVA